MQNMQNMQNMPNMQNMQNAHNQTYQTKSTKPNFPNQTYQTKPKLLVKAVDSWVRSAFGNVYLISIFTVHTLFCLIICSLYFCTKDSLSAQYDVFHCYPFFCIVSPVLKMSEIYVSQQMTWQCFGWVWKLDTTTSDYKVHIHMKHFFGCWLVKYLKFWVIHFVSEFLYFLLLWESFEQPVFWNPSRSESAESKSSLSTDSLLDFDIAISMWIVGTLESIGWVQSI